MIIDGKQLASGINSQTQLDVKKLKSQNITPHLAIVTVGGSETWEAYVSQKLKKANEFGIKAELIHLEENEPSLIETIERLNNDHAIHGIIVQRPIPPTFGREKITNLILPDKDVDGFREDSYPSPIWLTVKYMLTWIAGQHKKEFSFYIHNKTFVVVGKGETGGRPVIKELNKLGIYPIVIDSKTDDYEFKLKQADIVISAVGKKIVLPQVLKNGVVLIGIGLSRGDDGNLQGDYEEKEIKDVASFYSPSPGGVGPLNLAFLFKNLVEAAKRSA